MPMKFTENELQAFRLVNLDGSKSSVPHIQYIEARFDRQTQQHLIFWSDITSAYKDAVHIKKGIVTLSFLMDDNYEYPAKIGDSDNRKCLQAEINATLFGKQGGPTSSPVAEIHSEAIPSYEATISTRPAVEELVEPVAASLRREVLLSGAATQANLADTCLEAEGGSPDYPKAIDW
ncbi:hypothetical protein BX616_000117 [Lobosporangium transversale]|nr:hypothetical protein BX616_000117 [Lobosporangium transversale]